MPAISQKLPVITLNQLVSAPPLALDFVPPVSIYYTITLNYKHFADGGTLQMDWTPEYATDFVSADDSRTRGKRLNGWRFNMQLKITDAFLKTGVANSYEQEEFEDYLMRLAGWETGPTKLIYVQPYNDRDYQYICTLDGFTKTPHTYSGDNSFKTLRHDYTIALSAKQLTQTYPEPSTRPWS